MIDIRRRIIVITFNTLISASLTNLIARVRIDRPTDLIRVIGESADQGQVG